MNYLNKNLGLFDRIVRLILGIIFVALGIINKNVIVVFLGLFAMYEAISSWCIFYAVLGKNTCPPKQKGNRLFGVFLSGAAILSSAIIINITAKLIGIVTWYDFLSDLYKRGLILCVQDMSFVSFIFLFVIYPLFLGAVSYFSINYFLPTSKT